MLIKMKMGFVNIFENQDRLIEAFIQEDWHPVPKPVKIISDRNSNLLLHGLPPTGIRPNFKSQIYSSLSLSLSFSLSFFLLPTTSPRMAVGVGQESTRKRGDRKRKSVPDCKASMTEPISFHIVRVE